MRRLMVAVVRGSAMVVGVWFFALSGIVVLQVIAALFGVAIGGAKAMIEQPLPAAGGVIVLVLLALFLGVKYSEVASGWEAATTRAKVLAGGSGLLAFGAGVAGLVLGLRGGTWLVPVTLVASVAVFAGCVYTYVRRPAKAAIPRPPAGGPLA